MHVSTFLFALALLPIGLAPAGPASTGAAPVSAVAPAQQPQQQRTGAPAQAGSVQGGTSKPGVPGKAGAGAWPWGNAREAQRIEHEFCGVWQLFRLDVAGTSYLGSECHGYLIAQPGYCSLQFRILDRAEGDRRVVFPGSAAGTYRWKYDSARLLIVLETLLGADDLESESGELRHERQGFSREYRIDLAGDEMTLDRGPQTRLLFRRVPDSARPPLPEPIEPAPPESGRDGRREERRDGR